jgi:hypothetical protein
VSTTPRTRNIEDDYVSKKRCIDILMNNLQCQTTELNTKSEESCDEGAHNRQFINIIES